MARKLNLMLFEIAANPKSALMSKEALERLFQSEIVRMSEHMENLQFAGQRTPEGFHRIENLSADLEVGWAYRLLEKFGTRRVLFADESCQGWRFLKQSNVPEALHAGIAMTYRGEREEAETPVFVRQMRTLMEEHDLPYSILNFEKAKAEYFKARADVLLNTEERYLIEYPDEQEEVEQIAPQVVQPVLEVRTEPAPQLQPITPQSVVIGPPMTVPVTAQPAVPLHGNDLPVRNFMKECELLIANNRENWNVGTAKDVRTIVRIFAIF